MMDSWTRLGLAEVIKYGKIPDIYPESKSDISWVFYMVEKIRMIPLNFSVAS